MPWPPVIATALASAVLVVLTDVLRFHLRGRLPAVTWNPLEPWLPTLVAARRHYAFPPWPLLLTVTALATTALVVAAVAVWCSAVRRRVPAAAAIWIGVVVAAVITVGAAQAGEAVLNIQMFGGRAGSFIRTFTFPALVEAVRWGLLWGWLPALVYALSRGPSAGQRPRHVGRTGALLLLCAAVAGLLLAWVAHDAAISTQTAVV